jgi:hypothetical protein
LPQHEQALAPPWSRPPERSREDEPPLLPPRPDFDAQAPISAEAVRVRARAAQARGEAALRKMGVRVVRLWPRAVPSAVAMSEASSEASETTSEVDGGRASREG